MSHGVCSFTFNFSCLVSLQAYRATPIFVNQISFQPFFFFFPSFGALASKIAFTFWKPASVPKSKALLYHFVKPPFVSVYTYPSMSMYEPDTKKVNKLAFPKSIFDCLYLFLVMYHLQVIQCNKHYMMKKMVRVKHVHVGFPLHLLIFIRS